MQIQNKVNIKIPRDEVRIYPREARLDNSYASSEAVEAQVLLINTLGDRLELSSRYIYDEGKEISCLWGEYIVEIRVKKFKSSLLY